MFLEFPRIAIRLFFILHWMVIWTCATFWATLSYLLNTTFLYEYKSLIDFLYLAGYRNPQHVSIITQSKTISQYIEESRLDIDGQK